MSPIPIQSTASSSAPMLASAETPRSASSFIRTTRQSPSSGSQSSVCSPVPAAEATQNASDSGGGSDAHEQGAVALRKNADRSEERVQRPLGVAVEVDTLGHDRVRRRRKLLGRRHDETVVVALRLVDRDERASAREQRESHD